MLPEELFIFPSVLANHSIPFFLIFLTHLIERKRVGGCPSNALMIKNNIKYSKYAVDGIGGVYSILLPTTM